MKIQDQRAPDGPPVSSRPAPQQALVFWAIWFSILTGSIVIHVLLGHPRPAAPEALILDWFGLAPLVGSIAMRWWLFPRFTDLSRALVVFIFGLSLAEMATILATFLATGPAMRIVAVSGMLAILMWAPVFASKLTPSRPR